MLCYYFIIGREPAIAMNCLTQKMHSVHVILRNIVLFMIKEWHVDRMRRTGYGISTALRFYPAPDNY